MRYLPNAEEAAKITGRVDLVRLKEYPHFLSELKGAIHYVGSADDITDVFLFENAKTFVHQDVGEINASRLLCRLSLDGIMSNSRVLDDNGFRKETAFEYLLQRKKPIEYYGKKFNGFGQRGDIGLFVPKEASKGLSAIYAKAVPYIPTLKMVVVNLLPHLKLGAYFVDFPLQKKDDFVLPKDIGLDEISEKPRIFRKSKHLSRKKLETILDYNKSKYLIEIAD